MSAVRLRLSRWGSKGESFYGIVAAPRRMPRDRKFIESVGTYNAKPDANGLKHIELDIARIKYWLANGALPSERVSWLLEKANVMPRTPGQQHRTGEYDPTDPTSWKIMYINSKNHVIGVDSNKNALDRLSGTKFEVEIPSRLPDYAYDPNKKSLYSADITLTQENNKPVESTGTINDDEKLRILKAFMGFRN